MRRTHDIVSSDQQTLLARWFNLVYVERHASQLPAIECLGCCGLAPVVTVGGEVHGRTSSLKIAKTLAKIKKKEQRQSSQLAV
ncbi:MAG: hypothetical protein HN400_01055 [Nitrospinaceae bacterium]|nr:hypothetical protein [Nitrospinaceae bacterium]